MDADRLIRRPFLTRLTCFALAIGASGCVADAITVGPREFEIPGSPISPASPVASGPAFIWALVVDPSGVCIAGATIYVVSGPFAGHTFLQDSNCDAWAYSGGVTFAGLAVGVTMTLRATAVGYTSVEKTAVAASSGQAVEFDLTPDP
jgi:hypothetical protein